MLVDEILGKSERGSGRFLKLDEKALQDEFTTIAAMIEDVTEAIQIGMLTPEEKHEAEAKIKEWQVETHRIYDLLIDNGYARPIVGRLEIREFLSDSGSCNGRRNGEQKD